MTDSFKTEGGDSEDRVEEESDKQFDTTSGLLEKIVMKTQQTIIGKIER